MGIQIPLDISNIALSKAEIERYSRHLLIPDVGIDGQKRLKAAKVLCVGTGGLGSPVALYLAAAGVGTLGLVDYDVVDESNLQRQVIHSTSTVGQQKVDSARDRLLDLNPMLTIQTYNALFTAANALEIATGYDLIIDGTDNFPTRYLVDDVCAMLGIPNVYGSIFRFEGQLSIFWAKHGPTYRDLYPEPPPPGLVPSCAEGGVLGILPGTIGTLQATEAVKLITGIGDPMIGRLLIYDALEMRMDEIRLRQNPNRQPITELIDYEQFCGMPQNDHLEDSTTAVDISVQQLKAMLDSDESFRLIDVREPHEWDIVHIEGAELIPLGEIPAQLSTFNSADTFVMQCRTGKRSAEAVDLLKAAGITKIHNLAGGIVAWAEEIDTRLPTY